MKTEEKDRGLNAWLYIYFAADEERASLFENTGLLH